MTQRSILPTPILLGLVLLALTPFASSLGAAESAAGSKETATLTDALLNPSQVEPISKEDFQGVLEHHRGQVVLVNFWATWCIPCVQELPELNLLQTRYQEKGLKVIAVSLDDLEKLEDRVRPFFAKTAPDLVSYLATDDDYDFVGALDPDWFGALPTTFFIDRQGVVQSTHQGRLIYKQLEKEVRLLLDG